MDTLPIFTGVHIMMTHSLRFLPALAAMVACGVAADAWRRRVRAHKAKDDLTHHLKTWEGEGGNLPPAPDSANDESSLATSAP